MPHRIEALSLLQGLPNGWDWSINKNGDWYHIVIANRGLRHEPVYTNAGMMGKSRKTGLNTPASRDLLACVKAVYKAYQDGETVQNQTRDTVTKEEV